MEIRQHEWLSASPHDGFEQMRLKSRPKEPSPSLTRVGANFYSSVKQQDYSASVWLRRKDKLEHVSAARSPGPRPCTCRTRTPAPRPGAGTLPAARPGVGASGPPAHPGPLVHFPAGNDRAAGGEWGAGGSFWHCLAPHTSTSLGCRCGGHSRRVPEVPYGVSKLP